MHETDQQVIQWMYYIFVGLGKHNTLESAENAADRYIPGITKRLAKSDLVVRKMSSFDEIVNSYRSMFQLKDV